MSFFFCLRVLSDASCYRGKRLEIVGRYFLQWTYRGQPSTDSTSLLYAEVKGSIFLLLVELPEVLSLLLVDNSQNPGDGLADGVAVRVSEFI